MDRRLATALAGVAVASLAFALGRWGDTTGEPAEEPAPAPSVETKSSSEAGESPTRRASPPRAQPTGTAPSAAPPFEPQGTPAPPPEGPAEAFLPQKLRERPFKLADGSFRHLFAGQQAAAAERACWAPLAQAEPYPPHLAYFSIWIDDEGRVQRIRPSLKQPANLAHNDAGAQVQKQLLDCLQPFVETVRAPPGPAQFGEVAVSRPTGSTAR